jgi:hypothetical protein
MAKCRLWRSAFRVVRWQETTLAEAQITQRSRSNLGVLTMEVLSQSFREKIVRQRRHITKGQFANLATADPLSLFDRAIAILEDSSGVVQERFTRRCEQHSFRGGCPSQLALRLLSNRFIPSSPSRS